MSVTVSSNDRGGVSQHHGGFRADRFFGRGFVVVALSIAACLSLIPLVWLVLATFKSSGDIFGSPFLPTDPVSGKMSLSRLTLGNYHDLFTTEPFARYLLNSVFVACAGVVIQLFFSSLAGFALAKYNFPGKKVFYLFLLGTLMIPGQVTLAPTYELLFRMHLVDTFTGLLVPGAVSVFGIFLFDRALQQVPDELIHAARIDGCNELRIYWYIVMPMVRPMIGAFCLISFMGSWNSFLWPQIMLHSKENATLPIALSQMVGIYNQQYGMLMAGTFIAVLPVIVLFFMLQKEFVAGLTSGAVKG
jgi:ABC-type glycerol-3-phosphate transport system permease component